MATRLNNIAMLMLRAQKPLLLTRGFKRCLMPTLKTLKKRKEAMEPQPIQKRSTFPNWNYKAEIFAFGKRVGEDFDNGILRRALTTKEYVISEIEQQKSVGIENPEVILSDNSNMIESGEKIISDYTIRFVRTVFPKLPEEGVCALHNYLVSENNLSMLASNIGIEDVMLTSEFPAEKSTLSNGFKAVVSALAECSGLDRANIFVRDFVLTQLVGKNINEIWQIEDPVRLLSDILERDGRTAFEPRIVGESGRNTILANYQVGLYVDKQLIGLGFGENISTAKEMAARDALVELFDTSETMKPIDYSLEINDSSKKFANLSIQDWCVKNVEKLAKKN